MTDIKSSDDRTCPQPSLEDLGYLPEQAKEVEAMAMSPGICIVSGLTGSGKSTTVAAVVAIAQRAGANVVILQDELEPVFKGLPHTPVDTSEKCLDAERDPWTKAVQQSMRSAPDVVVVGELRDEESVRAAFELAASGCRVWTTIHTMMAEKTLERLQSLGVGDDLVFDPSIVAGLIHQIRAPKLPDGYQVLAEVIRTDAAYMSTYSASGADAARTLWERDPKRLTFNAVAMKKIQDGTLDPVWFEERFGRTSR